MKMADSSDEVVPASLQCGICSQLCKRGVKVHSWLMISIQVFQFSFQQVSKYSNYIIVFQNPMLTSHSLMMIS